MSYLIPIISSIASIYLFFYVAIGIFGDNFEWWYPPTLMILALGLISANAFIWAWATVSEGDDK